MNCPYCGSKMFHDRDINVDSCGNCGYDEMYHSREGYDWRAGMARIREEKEKESRKKEEESKAAMAEAEAARAEAEVIVKASVDKVYLRILELYAKIFGVTLESVFLALFRGQEPFPRLISQDNLKKISDSLRDSCNFSGAEEVKITVSGEEVYGRISGLLKDDLYGRLNLGAEEILRHNISEWMFYKTRKLI